jgi:hypothetical protein
MKEVKRFENVSVFHLFVLHIGLAEAASSIDVLTMSFEKFEILLFYLNLLGLVVEKYLKSFLGVYFLKKLLIERKLKSRHYFFLIR